MSYSGLDFWTCPECKTLTVDSIIDNKCVECREIESDNEWWEAIYVLVNQQPIYSAVKDDIHART